MDGAGAVGDVGDVGSHIAKKREEGGGREEGVGAASEVRRV